MRKCESAHLLILGGTGEAAALARAALGRFGDRLAVTSSLAGRTERPAPLPGRVRIGGFGGAEGLARHLREANHPIGVEIALLDGAVPYVDFAIPGGRQSIDDGAVDLCANRVRVDVGAAVDHASDLVHFHGVRCQGGFHHLADDAAEGLVQRDALRAPARRLAPLCCPPTYK